MLSGLVLLLCSILKIMTSHVASGGGRGGGQREGLPFPTFSPLFTYEKLNYLEVAPPHSPLFLEEEKNGSENK